MRLLLRAIIPVGVVLAVLTAIGALLLVWAFIWGHAVIGLGVLLIATFPLNCVALGVVIQAALRPPHDGVMNERVQQFLLTTVGSGLLAVDGVYFIRPIVPVGVATMCLVVGMLAITAKPTLFLWAYWRLRRGKAT